jgi:uncharacterized protein (DUF1330 family)
MAKGYWIARVDVHDPDRYEAYRTANAAAFAKYGARFLVRAGRFESVEGLSRGRNIVLEFPSYDAAIACWNSPEYKEALAHRTDPSIAVADVIIIEGYDGPQPG